MNSRRFIRYPINLREEDISYQYRKTQEPEQSTRRRGAKNCRDASLTPTQAWYRRGGTSLVPQTAAEVIAVPLISASHTPRPEHPPQVGLLIRSPRRRERAAWAVSRGQELWRS
jgi:hypothetical protein